MIVKNSNMEDMQKALDIINKDYDNNIKWKRFDKVGNNIRFTLRCVSSRGKGAKIGYNGRHTISACWHVHGDFFDALLSINDKAIIKTAKKTIDKNGGNWEDWNIGSIMFPLYYSEACNC
jgi:hypothetical protein